MCAKATKATPEQLRAEIEKLISAFGIDAAFLGINSDNPIPDDPTPKILALFATFLASIEMPEPYNTKLTKLEAGFEYDVGYNSAVVDCQTILTKIAEEMRKANNE